MFSQPSEILDFRLRREVIIPQKQANDVCGGTTVPCPAAAGPFDGTMFSVAGSYAFRPPRRLRRLLYHAGAAKETA